MTNYGHPFPGFGAKPPTPHPKTARGSRKPPTEVSDGFSHLKAQVHGVVGPRGPRRCEAGTDARAERGPMRGQM